MHVRVWVGVVIDLNACGCVEIDLNMCECVVIDLDTCGCVVIGFFSFSVCGVCVCVCVWCEWVCGWVGVGG